MANAHTHIDALSNLLLHQESRDEENGRVLARFGKKYAAIDYVRNLTSDELSDFLELANQHHVIVRALLAIEGSSHGAEPFNASLSGPLLAERSRIDNAIAALGRVYDALTATGAKVAVIKSLDHWPDLGSDIDLYTTADSQTVARVMTEKFDAVREPRSWGDRLANKWNFRVPGLPELIEVHVRYLGQTGEQTSLARRVLERSVTKTINGHEFRVPAPEERILISTLQRMYRHFYFRLCDVLDSAGLIWRGELDFDELQRGARLGGIWPGVATYLVIVARYVARHIDDASDNLFLPAEVIRAGSTTPIDVKLRNNFLRVPMGRAAGLYGTQVLSAAQHGNLRAISRLPLLPPLAISALVAYKLTGSDKGVW